MFVNCVGRPVRLNLGTLGEECFRLSGGSCCDRSASDLIGQEKSRGGGRWTQQAVFAGNGEDGLASGNQMEIERQQSRQLVAILGQVVEDLRNRCLHGLERVMPAAQRLLAYELPQTFDEVEIGRIGGQELEHEHDALVAQLFDVCGHQFGVLVFGVVQVEDELVDRRLPSADFVHEGDDGLGVERSLGDTDIEVLVILGAQGAEHVEAVAAAADAHVEALAAEQPAGKGVMHAVGWVPAIDEVAACAAGLGFGGLFGEDVDVCFLLVAVGLEQEAADLMEAAADAVEELFGTAQRIGHAKGLLEVTADLAGAVEAAGANFRLEVVDLRGGQVARIAVKMKSDQSVETPRAKESQPMANGARFDAEQLDDFGAWSADVGPLQDEQSFEYAGIAGRRHERVQSLPSTCGQVQHHGNPLAMGTGPGVQRKCWRRHAKKCLSESIVPCGGESR